MAQQGAALRRIEREPMGDRAYAQLRTALLAGRFESGETLPLRSLAESFGTSITPVRDAVSRLIAQSVLEQGPRNAALVPAISVETLRHLTLVRNELEGLAAREAAKQAAPADVQELTETLERMRSLIAKREMATYLDLHRAFHFRVYGIAGVPLLAEMIENLWLRCGPVLSFVVPDYVLSLKGTDHHNALLTAIEARDPLSAERAIQADIREASNYLESLADDEGFIHRAGAGQN